MSSKQRGKGGASRANAAGARAAFTLLPLLVLAACSGNGPPPPTEIRSTRPRLQATKIPANEAQALAAGNLDFAFNLHARLRAASPGNFVFSQTSISLALAMLYAGAAGGTADQMASVMQLNLPVERVHAAFNALDQALQTPPDSTMPGAFRLSIANSTWVQDGFSFLPSYLDLLAENYGVGVFVEDFARAPDQARATINAWVAEQTEREIADLFPPQSIDPRTVLVLANAVFFHGDWSMPFSAPSAEGTFHAPAGDVRVPMMSGSSSAFLWNGPGWSAASLGYQGGGVSMLIVVPDAGTFDSFEQTLGADTLAAVLLATQSCADQCPTPPTLGDLVLPKFSFATDAPLKDTLAALGMPDAFGGNADFSGIDGGRDLFVQAVLHKAVISVDEKGTTAAAATGVSVGRKSALPVVLTVDRPFLFFIRHEQTGALLFQGRVVDPSR